MVRCGHAACCILFSLVMFLRNATMIMQGNVDPVCRLTCRFPRYLVCQYYGLHKLPPTPFQLHGLHEKSDFALYQSKTFHSFTSFIQRSRKERHYSSARAENLSDLDIKQTCTCTSHRRVVVLFFVTDEALEARTAALRHRHLEVSR